MTASIIYLALLLLSIYGIMLAWRVTWWLAVIVYLTTPSGLLIGIIQVLTGYNAVEIVYNHVNLSPGTDK